MEIWELFIIGVGLSMDAFAVSICKGLSCRKASLKNLMTVGLYFGGFQALMPLLGYWLGTSFQTLVSSVDHWIAFILLALIGANMIREARSNEEEQCDSSFSAGKMLPLAVATSIDALAVGVSFAFLKVNIYEAITLIGATTFVLSAAGLWVGTVFGSKYKSGAEMTGGIVLILMGCKILIDHLGLFH